MNRHREWVSTVIWNAHKSIERIDVTLPSVVTKAFEICNRKEIFDISNVSFGSGSHTTLYALNSLYSLKRSTIRFSVQFQPSLVFILVCCFFCFFFLVRWFIQADIAFVYPRCIFTFQVDSGFLRLGKIHFQDMQLQCRK